MKKYKKTSYVISAQKVPAGIHVHNVLEDSNYITSDEKCIILTGTVGEMWTVTEDKLRSTYSFENGTPIEDIPHGEFKVRTRPDGAPIYAEQTTEQVQVETPWGEILTANRDGIPHGAGDYIVCSELNGKPNPDDRWVVNGEIFPNSYEEV